MKDQQTNTKATDPGPDAAGLCLYRPSTHAPAHSDCVWADGTRFRVWALTPDQWEAIPESRRPDGWLDSTGNLYFAFTESTVEGFDT